MKIKLTGILYNLNRNKHITNEFEKIIIEELLERLKNGYNLKINNMTGVADFIDETAQYLVNEKHKKGAETWDASFSVYKKITDNFELIDFEEFYENPVTRMQNIGTMKFDHVIDKNTIIIRTDNVRLGEVNCLVIGKNLAIPLVGKTLRVEYLESPTIQNECYLVKLRRSDFNNVIEIDTDGFEFNGNIDTFDDLVELAKSQNDEIIYDDDCSYFWKRNLLIWKERNGND